MAPPPLGSTKNSEHWREFLFVIEGTGRNHPLPGKQPREEIFSISQEGH